MVNRVVQRGGQAQFGAQGNTEQQVSDVGYECERQHSLEVGLGDSSEDADYERQPGHYEQRCAQRLAEEQKRFGADDGVDADFRQQAREYRGNGGRGGRVGVGQPERQREDRGFDAEAQQQRNVEEQLDVLGQHAEFDREVCHVDGSGGRVDQPNGTQEDERAQQ